MLLSSFIHVQFWAQNSTSPIFQPSFMQGSKITIDTSAAAAAAATSHDASGAASVTAGSTTGERLIEFPSMSSSDPRRTQQEEKTKTDIRSDETKRCLSGQSYFSWIGFL